MASLNSSIPITALAAVILGCVSCQPPVDAPSHAYLFNRETTGEPVTYRLGSETRRVVDAPYRLNKWTALDQAGRLDIESLVERAALHDDAVGLKISIEPRGNHDLPRHDPATFVPLERSAGEFAALDPLPVVDNPEGSIPVTVNVVEVLPPSRTYASKEAVVPMRGALDFGIGLGEPHPPMGETRFTIRAEVDDASAVVFEHVIDPRQLATSGWQDFTVDLSAYAGKSVVFRFTTEYDDSKSPSLDSPFEPFPVWSDPLLYAQDGDSKREAANLILISLDTLRADHLGFMGYDRDTSPNLDAFVKEGVIFEQAISQAMWTTPSHASVFTGLAPSVHGAGVHSKGYSLKTDETTLADLARANGYLTAAFTEGVAVRGTLGFSQGFDRYADGTTRLTTYGLAARTFRSAADWLASYGHLPFFLFVHTYQVHYPYDPPKEFREKFGDHDLALADQLHVEGRIDEARPLYVDLYDGEIAYTDQLIGRFLDRVRELGLLENTAVVIFSDHGEYFAEHGEFGHLEGLFDELIHVPLYIRPPGDDRPTRRVPDLVSLTDFFATAVDMMNWDAKIPRDSKSLVPLFRENAAPPDYEREFVMSESKKALTGVRQETGKLVEWTERSVRSDKEKYILSNREWMQAAPVDTVVTLKRVPPEAYKEHLYDLEQDPGEQSSLAAVEAQRIAFLSEALRQYLQAMGIEDSKTLDAATADHVPLTEQEIKDLEALGYL